MKCYKYIGFDLHQATTVVAVPDADGKVAMETSCERKIGQQCLGMARRQVGIP
jgi:hypothetical protein